MKNFLTCFAIFFAANLMAQNSEQLVLKSKWDDNSLPAATWPPGTQYSSVWGLAVNGTEIAVLSNALYVLFFDVTKPENPKLIGKFAGNTVTTWREFKSYKNRLYAVSDGTTEGLMIFDCSQAPDTIVRTYFSNELFERSHAIMLDTASGHIYLNGNNVNDMLVLDVSQNPDLPTVWSNTNLQGGNIHDSYVRGDTLYASHGYNGLYIYDFKSNPNAPKLLASISTGGYNHNNWPHRNNRYLYYTEEIPKGRPIQIVDLQDLANNEIEIVGSFLDALTPDPAGEFAIPHNVYIKDDLLFDSQYEDGLLVYDISDPLNPVLLYTFDTSPSNVIYNGYLGCWGNYPWLPSGTILASDMQNGLSVLTIPSGSSPSIEQNLSNINVFPNPVSNVLKIDAGAANIAKTQVFNSTGRLVFSGENMPKIQVADWPAGIYFIDFQLDTGKKVVKKFCKV